MRVVGVSIATHFLTSARNHWNTVFESGSLKYVPAALNLMMIIILQGKSVMKKAITHFSFHSGSYRKYLQTNKEV